MPGRPIQILLVEDSESDAVLLEATLMRAKSDAFAVTRVERISDAVRQLQQNTFDIILSDLGLPDSRGADTFAQLRQYAATTPVILLTGLDDENLALQLVHAGAQDYLVKGQVPADLLVRAVRYAIERKGIEDELRRRNEQMAQDLRVASEFQQAFLPRKFPAFPHGVASEESTLRFYQTYRPSGSVGGDFYSVFPIAETHAGVFFCDVMGHGVQAALVTAMIRALLEELKPLAPEPTRFMGEINHYLVEVLRQADRMMFVTAFYIVADAVTREWRWTSAGHHSPLVIQQATGTVTPLVAAGQPTGPVLGLFDQTTFPTNAGQGVAGDLVMLFTDGLFEVPNADGVEFGLQNLEATVRKLSALPAQRLFDELVAEIARYAAPNDFPDDVCLLGVEFRS